MVANGGGGVSDRSNDVSGAPGPARRYGSLTRRQVALCVDRPIILPHLETLIPGSKRYRRELCHRWRVWLNDRQYSNGSREGYGGCPSLAHGGPTVAIQLHVIGWLSLKNSSGGDPH